MNNIKYKKLKLHQTYDLCNYLIQEYPESLDNLLRYLIKAKKLHNKRLTQKSIEQEYVVFDEVIETTNG